jgi:hypothetical protein
MSRFIKILAIINGILIPIFMAFFTYKYFSDLTIDEGYHQPESIIVGKDLEKAKKDSLVLQGITYEAPRQVYNSTNMYMPISVLTYQQAKEAKQAQQSAGDFNPGHFNYINVLFLDKDYKVIGQLLDRKASVSEIPMMGYPYNTYRDDIEIDKTVKNMAYKIGFEDSDKDGKLNFLDDHDLYISDLDGRHLTQVTSKKNIIEYYFINSNSEIFVQFMDRNGMRDEYNHVKFGVYNISTGLFTELNEIEKRLIEIESKLVE